MAWSRPKAWADDSGTRKTSADFSRENASHDRLTGGRRYLVRAADGSWSAATKAEFDDAGRRIKARRIAAETQGVVRDSGGKSKPVPFSHPSWGATDVVLYEHDNALPQVRNGTAKEIEFAKSFRPGILAEVTRFTESVGFDPELGHLVRVAAMGTTDARRFLVWKGWVTERIVETLSREVSSSDIMLPEVQATTTRESDEPARDVA